MFRVHAQRRELQHRSVADEIPGVHDMSDNHLAGHGYEGELGNVQRRVRAQLVEEADDVVQLERRALHVADRRPVLVTRDAEGHAARGSATGSPASRSRKRPDSSRCRSPSSSSSSAKIAAASRSRTASGLRNSATSQARSSSKRAEAPKTRRTMSWGATVPFQRFSASRNATSQRPAPEYDSSQAPAPNWMALPASAPSRRTRKRRCLP